MKEKILEGLKRAYSAKYGVGDELLQGYAESLASTGLVTEENLATVIQGQEHALKEFQRGFDKVRNESSNYKSQLEELKKKQEGQPSPQPNPQPTLKGGDEMPEWFKAYAETKEKEIEALKAAFTQDQTAARKKERDALFSKSIEGLADTYAKPIKDAYALLGDNVDDVKFQEFITNTQNSTKEIVAQQNTYVPSRGGLGNPSDKPSQDEINKTIEKLKGN